MDEEMSQEKCLLLGAPVDSGKRRRGCLMGPDAYRTAGLLESLRDLGHQVEDLGNLRPAPFTPDTDNEAAELLEVAMKRRLLVAPASTLRDVASNEQLESREYFQPLERKDDGPTSRQLGPFVRVVGRPAAPATPAAEEEEEEEEVEEEEEEEE